MINHILTGLSRCLPKEPPREAAHPWGHDDDCSWHSSSFELARGLDVIEHRDAPLSVFADTLPSFHPPKASSAT
jgi:hypothetical protein